MNKASLACLFIASLVILGCEKKPVAQLDEQSRKELEEYDRQLEQHMAEAAEPESIVPGLPAFSDSPASSENDTATFIPDVPKPFQPENEQAGHSGIPTTNVSSISNANPNPDSDQSGAPTRDSQSTEAPDETNAGSMLTVESSPNEVCEVFLQALKNGDSLFANQLLTNIAQLETARANLVLESPGVDGSTYELLPARYATAAQKVAEVVCLLTQAPGEEPVRITWMMRNQYNGWKISGMSIQISESGQSDLLSFENPRDLARIQSSIEEDGAASETTQEKTTTYSIGDTQMNR